MGAGASQGDISRTVQLRESPSTTHPASSLTVSAAAGRTREKVEWQFLNESMVWTPFPADVIARLEDAFGSKSATCQFIFANSRLSTVDFGALKQRIPGGGADRDVRRLMVLDATTRSPVDPFADEAVGGVAGAGFLSPLRATSSGVLNSGSSEFPITCVETACLAAHGSPVYSCSFSIDGKKILTGASDGSAKFWELETCFIRTAFENAPGAVLCTALSKSSDIGIVGCDDGNARVAKLDQPEYQLILEGHTHKVYGVCFAARDRKVFTGSMDCDVRQWDVQTGDCLRQTAGAHTSSVFFTAASSANEWHVLSAGDDCVLVQHDFRLSHSPVARFCGHSETLWGCDMRFDDGVFASCGMDRKVLVWDPRSPAAPVHTFPQRSAVHCVEFMPDGNHLLSSGRDKCFRLTDIATGDIFANCSAHSGHVFRVQYSAATSRVMTCGSDALVKLWRLDSSAAGAPSP